MCTNCGKSIITLLSVALLCRECWSDANESHPILFDIDPYPYVHSDGSPVLPNVSRPDLGKGGFNV